MPIPTVPLVELKRRLDAGESMVLVDVREPDEFEAGRMIGAISLPGSCLIAQAPARLRERSARVIVYCASGMRAERAARSLIELGYDRVEMAEPGFSRWRELGFPTEGESLLDDAARDRYARHVSLPEVGERGQAKLLASKVLVLGAGGLGSPAALYLAAAGVGTLGLVDADVVELSNLQRQILHATSRVGMPKVVSGASALAELNPTVAVVTYEERLVRANVERIVRDWDVVIDGCDNFPTRYLVSDASVRLGKPVVHGSIHRFEGQITTFVPGSGGPCYRCLYGKPPPASLVPNCQEAGVLGVLPGVIGTLQATEALKLLLGQGELLNGRLLTYDALRMRFSELTIRRDSECASCGDHPTITAYGDYEDFCRRS